MKIEQGNNLPRVKVTNQASIRKILYQYGPITRSEIAEQLSLTLPTITTNINSMIACGIVHEVANADAIHKSIGRKANPVNIVKDSRYFIGVEMRRDERHVCITDYRGNVIYSSSDKTQYINYDENIRQIGLMIIQAIHSKAVPEEKIAGIGVCLPGIIDHENGILVSHQHYNWYNKTVMKDLNNILNLQIPISIENDACARAYGVKLFQRELLNDVSSFAYLFIARGISCPLILTRSGFISSTLGTGEIGFMVMDATQQNDKKHVSGTLSNLSGERSLMEHCAEAMSLGKTPILREICGPNIVYPNMLQIIQAQEQGETVICDIIAKSVRYLGIAIANIDNFVHPECVLVDAKLFSHEGNRQLFLQTVEDNIVRPSTDPPKFIFIDHNNPINGAKGGAAAAIRFDLDTYIE